MGWIAVILLIVYNQPLIAFGLALLVLMASDSNRKL
jgi:hypothetical protein